MYLLFLLIAAYGCAAEQEKKGYWGEEGYSVTKIQDDVLKVTIREDAQSDTTSVGDATLTRCADAARRYGFEYFVFLDKRSLVIQCYKERPAETSCVGYEATPLSEKSPEE